MWEVGAVAAAVPLPQCLLRPRPIPRRSSPNRILMLPVTQVNTPSCSNIASQCSDLCHAEEDGIEGWR